VTGSRRRLGLRPGIAACLFDLDGVLTDTASVHAAAWRELFDAFLGDRAARTGTAFVPFDPVGDYERYVDGRTRVEGTRTFLASRGITLPLGDPADPPDALTIHGLGNRKNRLMQTRIRAGAVRVFEGSVRYVHAVREVGLRRAVVSSSANTADVLAAAGISSLFEVRIDGIAIVARGLASKPAPDAYLAAAEELGVSAAEAAVFEDATVGVEAAKAGGFGWVVGVDRLGHGDRLRRLGADVVVSDLGDLLEP
jgi:beta-phosphoglucomutase family hydrolase